MNIEMAAYPKKQLSTANSKNCYIVENGICFSKSEIRELFDSVGWEAETPAETLMLAFHRASHVVCIRDAQSNKLIAIARSMDDGCWNANIDCVVVHHEFQKKGVGTLLVSSLLEELKELPCISVSPNCKQAAPFYEKFGFAMVKTGCLLQLVK